MTRLIDADALTREACIKFYTTPYYKHILDLINNAPTVEKRPQCEWIKEDKPWGVFGDRVFVNTCPFCKESFVYHGNNPKFCSECGADMRGDEK